MWRRSRSAWAIGRMPIDRVKLQTELDGLESELKTIKFALPSRRSLLLDDVFLGIGLLATIVGLALVPITNYLSLGLTLIGAARLVYAAIKYADAATKVERHSARQIAVRADRGDRGGVRRRRRKSAQVVDATTNRRRHPAAGVAFAAIAWRAAAARAGSIPAPSASCTVGRANLMPASSKAFLIMA